MLTERDYEWFAVLHRHGPLPTSYLHGFTNDRWTDYRMASRRLALLYHEGNLLERPFKQFETLDPRSNELVHALGENANQALKEAGLFSSRAPTPSGTFKHQLMVSCITASIELGAREKSWRYIPQHELLDRAGADLIVDIDGLLRPDALFALEIGGKYLVFFLEADRATEPLDTKNIRKSWRHNVRQYRKLIGHGQYKSLFKLKADALLLNVTVSEKRSVNMIKIEDETSPKGCTYILNHYLPEFGSYFRPPQVIRLLDIAWKRASNSPYKIGQ